MKNPAIFDGSNAPGGALEARESIYGAEPDFSHPGKFFTEMARDIVGCWFIASVLFWRDFRGEYRQTLLGMLWIFLTPFVMTITFIILEDQHVINGTGLNIPYGAYVFIGSTLWQGFTDSVGAPTRVVNGSLSALGSVNFPRESLLVAAFMECALHMAIRMALLAFVFVYYDMEPGAMAVLAPAGILTLMALGFTIGLAFVPLGALYEDVEHVMGLALTFLFFLTPVAYPAPSSGFLADFNSWNPVTPVLMACRDMIGSNNADALNGFFLTAVLSFLSLGFTLTLYRVSLPHIIKRLQH